MLKSEDWMSLWIGLLIFVLSLGLLMGADILGWAVKTNVWVSPGQALHPVSEGYSGLGGGPSLVLTFLFLLVLMTVAARGLEAHIPRFMFGFTVIDRKPGEKVRMVEIWQRFPKFVLGYILTFVATLALCIMVPELLDSAKAAASESNVFRQLFFVMTFFAIGVVSNFRKLWEEGIGRLMAVYVLCLFGFIIWVGLAISWVFFHGITPPLVAG